MTAEPNPDDVPTPDAYELVMPFVVCATNGGPFDDDAYSCGWEAGKIDGMLAVMNTVGATQAHLLFREANEPQIELLLMKHGFRTDYANFTDHSGTTVEPRRSVWDGWVNLTVIAAAV